MKKHLISFLKYWPIYALFAAFFVGALFLLFLLFKQLYILWTADLPGYLFFVFLGFLI